MSITGLTETEENPIKVIRTLNGLSQRKAAAKIGCHYQLVYMAEHGMYFNIPPVLLRWLEDNSDSPRLHIMVAYDEFQVRRRNEAREKYSLGSLGVGSLGVPGENPVSSLRRYLDLSQSAFCKALCIPVALLYNSERDTAPSPKLLYIFEQLGIPKPVINEMIERYEIIDA